jgi:serine/threonine protein kinase
VPDAPRHRSDREVGAAVIAGKYELGRRIGGGGMAEVFEATAHGAAGFARPVAIKRMLPALSHDAAFGRMFVNEAQLASLLHHDNIGAVLDFDRDADGRHVLVMELIRGVDLRALAGSGPLPYPVIAYIASSLLAGLAYAHELEHEGRPLGIVHRDVSPHNVMLSWDGAVKLVDFGIAKAVAATGVSGGGGLKGKLAYMSPEQAHGLALDGRADLFAVGVICHELVTGERLFPGQTEAEVLARVLTQPVPRPSARRPDVPADLEAVILRLLERDRNARFATAALAHDALLSTAASDPRARLQLRELLRQRFAGAPRPRDGEPVTPSPASGPRLAEVATVPSGAAARAAMAEATRTSAVSLPRSRSALWLAVAIAAVAGAAVAVAVIAGGDEPRSAPAAVASPLPLPTPSPSPTPTLSPSPLLSPIPTPSPIPSPSPSPTPSPIPSPRAGKAAPGQLAVKVTPWAQVYVDGALVGETPRTVTLAPGAHQIRIHNPELGRTENRTVTIAPGEREEIRLRWTD